MVDDICSRSRRWAGHLVRDPNSKSAGGSTSLQNTLDKNQQNTSLPSFTSSSSQQPFGALNQQHASLKIHLFEIRDARSVGDVMRVLDAKHVIQGDFILVQGDVISNVNFKPLLEEFK